MILDEAHRARRRNLAPGREYDPAEPNHLLRFLWDISPRTRSLLLATATPVQLHPIEAWDLLDVLARGSDAILGGYGSPWRKPRQALELLLGETPLPTDEIEQWGWMRNPLPPAAEGPDYNLLRRSLGLTDQEALAPGGSFERLRPPDRARIRRLFPRFVERSNPFIRHIVRRTREYLETTLDIYNLRYAGSVEDRVHDLLSERLENLATLFGQIPDILEDVWIDLALGEIDRARKTIEAVPRKHPFQIRYHHVRKVDWESCARVLDVGE